MYVLIDKGQMAVIYKHQDKNILWALDWITCQNSATLIAAGDVGALSHFGILELQEIYYNATGHKMISIHNHMVRLVADLTMRMVESVVTGDPVNACKKLSPADKRHFTWEDGLAVPHNQAVLPSPIKVARNEDAEKDTSYSPPQKAVLRPVWQPTAADQTQLGAMAPAHITPRAQRQPSDPNQPKVQRSSGIRDTIYSVADEIWNAAGNPTDKSEILKLRKQMMEVLETQHDVKRNTSSNSLGDWQKLRIPS